MSTRIIFFLIAIFSGIRGWTQLPIQPNMVPYYSFKKNAWGISDSTGKIVVSVKYREIKLPYSTLAVCEPLAPQPNNGSYPSQGYDVYKTDGTFVRNVGELGDFREGFGVFSSKGKYGLMDTAGNITIPAIYSGMTEVKEQRTICYSGQTCLVVDTKGQVIISSDTISFSSFYKGRAFARGKSGRLGSIDLNGKLMWHKKQYPYFPMYSNSRSEVGGCTVIHSDKPNGKIGLIDYFGNEIVPARYERIYENASLIFVEDAKKKGVYTRAGKEVLPAEFDQIDWLWSDVGDDQRHIPNVTKMRVKYLVARREKLSGVVDSSGIIVLPVEYGWIMSEYKGIFKVAKEVAPGQYRWGFVDSTNKVIVPLEYKRVSGYRFGVAAVGDSMALRLVDSTGNFIGQNTYQGIEVVSDRSRDGLLLVYSNHKRGVIDSHGGSIIPCEYDEISLQDGLCLVKKGKLWGKMSTEGEVLWPVKFSWVGCYHDGYGWAKLDTSFVVVDSVGKIHQPEVACTFNVYSSDRSGWTIGFSQANCSGKNTWVNSRGEVIKPLQEYDGARYWQNCFYVSKNGKFGVVDTNYRMLMPLADRSVINRRSKSVFFVYITIQENEQSKGVSVFENVNGIKYYEL